jgi:serine/threonine-protein kinase
MIERLGHATPGRDSAYGLEYDSEILRFGVEQGSIRDWIAVSQTDTVPFIRFWYRENPAPLLATRANMHYEFSRVQAGRVSPTDPPLAPGMITVQLDPHGRLLEFTAVPSDVEVRPGGREGLPSVDWEEVLSLCGVNPATVTPTEPVRTPPVYCNTRAAWEGSFPGDSDVPMRIEACEESGKVVWVRAFGPWSVPGSADPAQPTAPVAAARTIDAIYGLALLLGGSLLALRNHRLRRCDSRGAFRLAVFVFTALLVSWALSADHAATIRDEVHSLLMFALAKYVFWTGLLWALYLALEPYVRRRWPDRIISWSRLLAGRWRDPLVGRDVLIGLAIGVVSVPLLAGLNNALRAAFGLTSFISTDEVALTPLLGVSVVGGVAAGALVDAIRLSLVFLISPVLVQMLVRKLWIAALVVWLVLTAFVFWDSGIHTTWGFAYHGVWVAMFLVVAIRLGLLASAATWFSFWALSFFPITSDMAKWYAEESLFGMLLLAGLGTVVFYTSLAGRPLLRDELLEA